MSKKRRLLKLVSVSLICMSFVVGCSTKKQSENLFEFRGTLFNSKCELDSLVEQLKLRKNPERANAYFCFFKNMTKDSSYLSCSALFEFNNEKLKRMDIVYYTDAFDERFLSSVRHEVNSIDNFIEKGVLKEKRIETTNLFMRTQLDLDGFKRMSLVVEFR